MTWREEKLLAQSQLRSCGVPDPENDAALLLYEVTGWSMTGYLMHQDEAADGQVVSVYHRLIERRCSREPLQHITGHQNFLGLDIQTGPQALIPRQDTEVLALLAGQFLQDERQGAVSALAGQDTLKALDLCTGTGCIAIFLALLVPQASVMASDLSPQALALARKNAEMLSAEVTFLEGDLYRALDDLPEAQRGGFALITANPPYIASEEILTLDPEVRQHDPLLALDGGRDGLMVYRPLIAGAGEHLAENGVLMVEIGADQADAVSSLMREAGLSDISVRQDLSGRDRVVMGCHRISV